MSLGVSYAMRFSLSLAIVEMVDYKVPIDPNATNVPKEALTSCKELIQVKVPSNESEVEADEMDKIMPADKFSWTEKEQAMILGSFFYGYCITQIPGGMLAQRYSAKYVLGIGILISAIFTILSPPAAIYLGKESFMVCRFIEGLAGVSFLPIWANSDGTLTNVSFRDPWFRQFKLYWRNGCRPLKGVGAFHWFFQVIFQGHAG